METEKIVNDFWGSFINHKDKREIMENERYHLAYAELGKLKAGMTILHPEKETRGHFHEGVEEVYYFISGAGKMIKGNKKFDVKAGDIVLIEDGAFHKVINANGEALAFLVVFNKLDS